MRSNEAMLGLVRREAAKRRNRRRAALAGGTAMAFLLVVGVASARPDDRPAEVSTAADDEARTADRDSTDRVEAGTTVPSPGVDPTTPAASTDVPASPTTTVAAGPGPGPTVRPGAPPTSSAATDPEIGPVATTPATTAAPPTTTAAPTSTVPTVRTCTADDILTTGLDIAIVGGDDEEGDLGSDIPVGATAELGYSTVVKPEVAACWTPDGIQRVTITDSSNRVVFSWSTDAGQRRLIAPGTWVTYQAVIPWDPSCWGTPLPPGVTRTCQVAPPGTYQVTVYDQGATIGPVPIRVQS